jgi:hypothetical protein
MLKIVGDFEQILFVHRVCTGDSQVVNLERPGSTLEFGGSRCSRLIAMPKGLITPSQTAVEIVLLAITKAAVIDEFKRVGG